MAKQRLSIALFFGTVSMRLTPDRRLPPTKPDGRMGALDGARVSLLEAHGCEVSSQPKKWGAGSVGPRPS
jgi:hypothetical protein